MATKLNAGGCMQCSAKTQEGLKDIFDKAVEVIFIINNNNQYVLEKRANKTTSSGNCTVM